MLDLRKIVVLFLLCVLVSGCVGSLFEERTPQYGYFFDPSDHIDELLAQGDVHKATCVFDENKSWFQENIEDSDVLGSLNRLCRALYPFKVRPAETALEKLKGVSWPAPPEQWAQAKKTIKNANQSLLALKAVPVLNLPECAPAVKAELQHELFTEEQRLRREASSQFRQYPLPLSQSFFKMYPVPIDEGMFWANHSDSLESALSRLGEERFELACKLYLGSMSDKGHAYFVNRYFQLALSNSMRQADLADIVKTFDKAEELGLRVGSVPGVNVAFVQATSDILKKKRLIEFPISFELDIPFKAKKAEGKHPYQSASVLGADFIVIVNVALAHNDRLIEKTLPIASTFRSGVRSVPNPEFDILKIELQNEALSALAQEKSEDKDERLEAYRKRLRDTPAVIEEPVYEPYEYLLADVFVKKTATVHYYIVDRRNKIYFTDTFDAQSNNAFKVMYNMHPFDIQKGKNLEELVAEKDVVEFEDSPITVPLSSLLVHYMENRDMWHSYSDLSEIREQIVEQQNVVLRKERDRDYGFSRHQDIRFESVVKVMNGVSSGSGFYVADDMVLTNYHVVEGAQFVELKLWSEEKSFGRVVAQDARLDLALIKVQERGRPVRFYDERFLPLGATVEAIGHPKNYDFTISRGIVSTVRKHSSINTVKGKSVMFVQTDCPINPGNSGGPLFMGESVIGVNDFGVIKSEAEGLNFAIHYSEIFQFLKHHNVEYLTEAGS